MTAAGHMRTMSPTKWKIQRVLQKVLSEVPALNPRTRSLSRGNVLVFGSLGCAWGSLYNSTGIWATLLPLAVLLSMLGTVDTIRNMQKRWNFYHGGVLLLIYADLMVIALLLFLSVTPLLFSTPFGR